MRHDKHCERLEAERDRLKADAANVAAACQAVIKDRDLWKSRAEKLADTVTAMRNCGSNDSCDFCLEISQSALSDYEKVAE